MGAGICEAYIQMSALTLPSTMIWNQLFHFLSISFLRCKMEEKHQPFRFVLRIKYVMHSNKSQSTLHGVIAP